jgi:DNA-binding MarR family transcriptional regulator
MLSLMSRSLPKGQDAVNPPRTAEGEALSRLVVQVFRLDGALTAAGDALARPAGQTSARWRVLAAIEQQPLTVAQIARAWSLARQSVQRIADALEHDGLLTYEENPSHRRAKLAKLTRTGQDTLTQIQAAQHTWANNLGRHIGASDLDAATAILARLLTTLVEP